MNTVVFGSSGITIAALETLIEIPEVTVAAVVHAPQEFAVSFAPTGFRNSQYADVGAWARERGITEMLMDSADDVAEIVGSLGGSSLGLVIGWHRNIPGKVVDAFDIGVLGVHASLLPDLRGHAPLSWAILRGQSESGVSLFAINRSLGVDEGDIYGQERFPVGPDVTIADLIDQTATATQELLRRALPRIAGGASGVPQRGIATYGLRREPADGAIDWSRSAISIDRLVRAITRPYPGAFTSFAGRKCLVWAARAGTDPVILGAPGQVAVLGAPPSPYVVTGDGWLEILEATDPDGADLMPELLRFNHRRLGESRVGT